MARIIPVLVTATLALPGLTAYAQMEEERAPASPAEAVPAPGPPPADDSARDELRAGRHWHAARLLRPRLDGGADDDPDTRFLLARAEAGWENWDAARRLLEDEPRLRDLEGGLGWILLGRAREAAGVWDGAVDAYREALGRPAAEGLEGAALRVRMARSLARAGRLEAARTRLDSIRQEWQGAADWLALELAEAAADRGDPGATRGFLDAVESGAVRERGGTLLPRAHAAAGDSAAAAGAWRRAALEREGAERARALAAAGGIALATGDTAAARRDLEAALEAAPGRSGGVGAAATLVDLPGVGADVLVRAARALAGAGRVEAALEAYERGAGDGASEEVRLEIVRLRSAGGVSSEMIASLERLAGSSDPDVAVGALDLLADAHRAAGRAEEARAAEERIVGRVPGSDAAVRTLYFRADRAHDRGELERAAEGYRRTAAHAPPADLAGLARMRLGQIHLTRGRPADAERVFRVYVEDFPEGARRDQAVFWRAHALRLLGREAEARALLRDLRERDFLSYYALLAGRVLGEEFLPDLPPGPSREEMPGWLRDGLRELDLRAAAGLEAGVDAAVETLGDRARVRNEELLRLSEELTERGHGLAGIGLGWELRRGGRPWSLRLLRAVFPFPHRELIRREAAEWGVDPVLVAAVARQESAFDVDIRSSANAVGLIQVLPETGRELAAEVGPEEFRAELLELPEVNLHLGTAYLLRLGDAHDGVLPFVLSAYNAGPHRADAWRDFPEAADPLRFTERIPFRETRNYVKHVTRNQALYRDLYEMGSERSGGPPPSADVSGGEEAGDRGRGTGGGDDGGTGLPPPEA